MIIVVTNTEPQMAALPMIWAVSTVNPPP